VEKNAAAVGVDGLALRVQPYLAGADGFFRGCGGRDQADCAQEDGKEACMEFHGMKV
jgi:hypothetical protein